MKSKIFNFCFLLAAIILSFGAIKPLFHWGFFPIHDNTQVVRVAQMAQALKDGQFPVRWVADLGYGFGYPIFNFYAPFPYYVGAFFNLIGFNALVATKIMMGLGVVLAGIFMYFLAKEFWGKFGGLASALFYVYAPYRAVDVYVRGAVGEFWAMAVLPLIFLGIYKIFQKNHWGTIIASLGFAGVILSHNLTAMMVVPFILISILVLFIFSKTKKHFMLHALCFMFLSLGLSAFYWLPALSEMSLTKVFGQIGGGADFRDHFVYFDQLWASPWGYGGSAPGRLDGMSFMIGKLHLLMAFFVFLIAIFNWKKPSFREGVILFAICNLILAIFFTNEISRPIWEIIKPMVFIQYPWRFLLFATFFASFLAGVIFLWFKKEAVLVRAGIFILLQIVLLALNLKNFQPQNYFPVKEADYLIEENIKWRTSKISDEYLPKDFPVPESASKVAWEKIEVISGKTEIKNKIEKTNFLKFEADVSKETEIIVNTAYFPGWKVWVNGKQEEIKTKEGKIKLFLPMGESEVILKFTNTPVRIWGNAISLFCLATFAWLVLKCRHGPSGTRGN